MTLLVENYCKEVWIKIRLSVFKSSPDDSGNKVVFGC